ncbi:glycosyltransferase family 39 protein [Thermococcus sp.]|uniref:glycosyltransferase family 39 protein n=1 Tax=Thermococcus sp. TaxID=35749 RepID=UPI00261C67E6|nr:glycosyltransferase family 39 protein [Thermococcus sp.]
MHPPLFYYLLALWLRIFGDSHVVGRALSLILGLISVVMAYFVGKEVKNERAGLLFSLLLATDPLMLRMNTAVYHETLIELFTVASLFYFVRYLKTERMSCAYLSLAIVSIGSSAKFTIIPQLLALFTFILLYNSKETREYLRKIPGYFLTFRQGGVILATYLLWTLVAVAVVTLYPTDLSRIVLAVPGIHPMNKMGNLYTAVLFLTVWAIMTVYLFRIRYAGKLWPFIRALIGEYRLVLILTAVVIASKAIVEVPLGLMVSPNYIHQTYLLQSNRGFMFMSLFWLVHRSLSQIESSSLELLTPWLGVTALLLIVLMARLLGIRFKVSPELSALLFLSGVFYLLLIPIIPNPRFIYPLILTSYLALIYTVESILEGFTLRRVVGISIAMLVVLGTADAGIVVNYPKGQLKIPHALHDREMRDDLGEYLEWAELKGTYLPINPMDGYYLHLKVIPYLVDTFGLGYLKGDSLLSLVREYKPDYIIFSTWMFAIMEKDESMRRIYGKLLRYSVQNGTLLFAEGFSNGERMEMYNMKEKSTWGIELNGSTIYFEGSCGSIGILPLIGSSPVVGVKLKLVSNGTYNITVISQEGEREGRIVIGESISIILPGTLLEIKSKGPVYHGFRPVNNTPVKDSRVYTPKGCLRLTGTLYKKDNDIVAEGNNLKIASGCGNH